MECCNTPYVTFHICNSNSCHFRLCVMIFPSWSAFVFRLHFVMSSCALHCIRVRLMHPSIFPVVRFAIRHSHLLRRTPLVSFRERVLNVLGMDRGLSSFVPFGGRLVLQRLTALSQRPLLSCSSTTLQNSPITHQSHLHALGHSITIVWTKTAPHLESPSSLYL